MNEAFSRTVLMFGEDAMKKLNNSRVAVFGVGGVGGYVVEALARSGVGAIDVIDNDTVSVSNINRQIIATTKTIGEYKVDAAKRRMIEINPHVRVTTHKMFFLPDVSDALDFNDFDYIVDAIDTVTGKIEIIKKATLAGVKVISSMGTGNKLDPTKLEVADIYKTSVCPLARVMRHELKKHGIKKLKVVYSKEESIKAIVEAEEGSSHAPSSNAFVPSVAGLIIAGEVIKDLIKLSRPQKGKNK